MIVIVYLGDFLDLTGPVYNNGAAMQDNGGQTKEEMLDATSRRPAVPWALVLLIVWSAVEATIFTVTLRPTMSELLADLTGFTVNPIALVVLLWIFLTIIIAGSFACLHVLKDAIAAKQIGNIRSEEHTSELQSHSDLVCRLLLE